MVCRVLNDDLVLRLGYESAARALTRKHMRPMDSTCRPIKSMVWVADAGIADDARLADWREQAIAFVGTLPPK